MKITKKKREKNHCFLKIKIHATLIQFFTFHLYDILIQ